MRNAFAPASPRLYEKIDAVIHDQELRDLNEGFRDALHGVLDVVGMIPGLGIPFDLANALIYATEGKFLFAGLSIISALPVIGDAIGAGGKVAIAAEKAAARLPKVAMAVKKVTPQVAKSKQAIQANRKVIDAVFDKLEQPPVNGKPDKLLKIRPYVTKIRQALDVYAGSGSGMAEKPWG
jgi:hypothetical protein